MPRPGSPLLLRISRRPVGAAFVASPRGKGARHLTVLNVRHGVRMGRRASALLDEGVRMRVVGLRWLMPLPVDDMVREANATGRVLVVDETKHGGGVGEGIVTAGRAGLRRPDHPGG